MKRLTALINASPLRIFIGFIVILITIIGLLSLSRQPELPEATPQKSKEVSTVTDHIIEVSSIAEVADSSVVTVYAQVGGIVSSVHKDNGDSVLHGATLISLGTNYAGGNAASVQSEIAAAQLTNYTSTYESHIKTLDLQKDLARTQDEIGDRTREIGRASVDRTQTIITTNTDSITQIENTLALLETSTDSEDQITTLTSTLNQLKATNSQLISANTNAAYQASDTEAPAHISDVQKELALKQLDLQRSAYDLQGDILALQKRSADIQASVFYPSAPFSGTIIQTFVDTFDVVSPGTKIATIKADATDIRLTTYVPFEVAEILTLETKAYATIANIPQEAQITYIGAYPTRGDLYPVTLLLNREQTRPIADKSYVDVQFSIISVCESYSSSCYLPLEAITITQDASFISVLDESNNVYSEEVTIEALIGNSAKVSGDNLSQKAILTQTNVLDGESVINEN